MGLGRVDRGLLGAVQVLETRSNRERRVREEQRCQQGKRSQATRSAKKAH
jgi:hypothetical protein